MTEVNTRRPVVRLAGVAAGYAQGDVLRGAEFTVSRGEVAFVSGPTAAGKSTLLHLLRLALPPSAGRAVILGEDPARLYEKSRNALKRRIGYIAEEPTFVERWSAFDNIALPLRLAGRKPAEYGEDVRSLISYVGLTAGADEPAWRLSAIERRRAAIARALAAKPDLLLADAPTAGLGQEAAARMVRIISELRRVGAAVVITSQDESVAEGVPATRWRMAHGRIARADTGLMEAAE